MPKKFFPFRAARKIALLVLDIDGVFTDGGLYYSAEGLSYKRFNVQDGLAVKIAQELGLRIAVITGMDSASSIRRMQDLGITECHAGIIDKLSCLEGMRARLALTWDEVAYMGDDWIDLPPMYKVGLPLSVPNGEFLTRKAARYVTLKTGGEGAVREVIRHILTAQGKMPKVASFFGAQ